MTCCQVGHAKKKTHQSKASPLELVSFRFFMIPKQVHNMANRLILNDGNAYALKEEGTTTHVQLYLLGLDGSPTLQLFILIV